MNETTLAVCVHVCAEQCLSHTPALVQYLESGSHTSSCRHHDECVVCSLVQHLQRAVAAGKTGTSSIAPQTIIQRLSLIGKRLRVGRSEDAHEFMGMFLQAMQRCELRTMGVKDDGPRQLVESTFVHNVFGGYFQSRLR